MTDAGQDYISKSISDRRPSKLFGNLWSEHRVTRYTITGQNKYTLENLKLCGTCPGSGKFLYRYPSKGNDWEIRCREAEYPAVTE